MTQHSYCTVEIEHVRPFVCPKCGSPMYTAPHPLPVGLPVCACGTKMEERLPCDGSYPIKKHCKEHYQAYGSLAERYQQRILMGEIKEYLIALECVPCIAEINVGVLSGGVMIDGWVLTFTAEAQEVAHHAIYTSLVRAATNLAHSAAGAASLSITYEQTLRDEGEE